MDGWVSGTRARRQGQMVPPATEVGVQGPQTGHPSQAPRNSPMPGQVVLYNDMCMYRVNANVLPMYCKCKCPVNEMLTCKCTVNVNVMLMNCEYERTCKCNVCIAK